MLFKWARIRFFTHMRAHTRTHTHTIGGKKTANKSHTTLSCNNIIILVARLLMPHNDPDNGHQLASVWVSVFVAKERGWKRNLAASTFNFSLLHIKWGRDWATEFLELHYRLMCVTIPSALSEKKNAVKTQVNALRKKSVILTCI